MRIFHCSRTGQKNPADWSQNCGCDFQKKLPVFRAGYTPPASGATAAKTKKSVGVAKACSCTTQCGSKACPCFAGGLCGPMCHAGIGAGAGKCRNSASEKLAKREAAALKSKQAKHAKAVAKAAGSTGGQGATGGQARPQLAPQEPQQSPPAGWIHATAAKELCVEDRVAVR